MYVFHSYDLDSGPILKTGPAFSNKMPAAALNLSTHERPDLFGISYVDAPYITLLDTAHNMWTRRYGTKRIGIDLFAFPDRKTHGYVYFSGEDSYFCVRKMDDVREDCDQVMNFKIKTTRADAKGKGGMDFSGLVDNSDEQNGKSIEDAEDEDSDGLDAEDIYEDLEYVTYGGEEEDEDEDEELLACPTTKKFKSNGVHKKQMEKDVKRILDDDSSEEGWEQEEEVEDIEFEAESDEESL